MQVCSPVVPPPVRTSFFPHSVPQSNRHCCLCNRTPRLSVAPLERLFRPTKGVFVAAATIIPGSEFPPLLLRAQYCSSRMCGVTVPHTNRHTQDSEEPRLIRFARCCPRFVPGLFSLLQTAPGTFSSQRASQPANGIRSHRKRLTVMTRER